VDLDGVMTWMGLNGGNARRHHSAHCLDDLRDDSRVATVDEDA
jgi:hypothetical protein